MIVGLGQDQAYEGATPAQTDIDYVTGLYQQYGYTHGPEFYWVQAHAGSLTSGEKTREQLTTDFSEYFATRATAEGTTVAEAAGVPSVTDVVNGFQMPTGVTDFLTGEMIAGVPNWLLLGAIAIGTVMLTGRK